MKPRQRRRLYATSVIATSTLLSIGFATASAAETESETLDDAVIASMEEASGQARAAVAASGREFQVNPTEEASGWSYGTAVLTAPAVEDAYPDGWLYLAHETDDGWQVGLDGDATFEKLMHDAPEAVVSSSELDVFSAVYERADEGSEPETVGPQATSSYTTELRLPFSNGQTWTMTGGPHGSPRASIDLAGGDGKVRAAGAGNVYMMCSSQRGWLRVYHPNGYTSDYYHLEGNINPGNGSHVSDNAFLGNIGTDVSCGGGATGPHVHWSILDGGTRVGWHLRSAGKWVFFNGASNYDGYALHGSRRVNVGGGVYNYGALRQNQGMIDVNGSGSLNKRSGPGTNYPVVGSVNDGATVTISCWHPGGTSHTGRYETTDVWDKLSDGTWISDAFVYSGMQYVGPRC